MNPKISQLNQGVPLQTVLEHPGILKPTNGGVVIRADHTMDFHSDDGRTPDKELDGPGSVTICTYGPYRVEVVKYCCPGHLVLRSVGDPQP